MAVRVGVSGVGIVEDDAAFPIDQSGRLAGQFVRVKRGRVCQPVIAQGIDRHIPVHLAGEEVAIAANLSITPRCQAITTDFGQNDVQVVAGHQRRVVCSAQPGAALLHKGRPVAVLNLVECQIQQLVAPSVGLV